MQYSSEHTVFNTASHNAELLKLIAAETLEEGCVFLYGCEIIYCHQGRATVNTYTAYQQMCAECIIPISRIIQRLSCHNNIVFVSCHGFHQSWSILHRHEPCGLLSWSVTREGRSCDRDSPSISTHKSAQSIWCQFKFENLCHNAVCLTLQQCDV